MFFSKRFSAILLATTHSALTYFVLDTSFKRVDNHHIQISSGILTFKDKCLHMKCLNDYIVCK